MNYAIPTGTCPTVGVTGLTLGGGIGLLDRTYGLTCDSVKSILLINAELEIIEASEKKHSDLFWALRGGGNGSYGVVLGFTFKIHYIPEVTFYELIWEWDAKKIVPIMKAWQKWVKTLPDNTSSVLGIRHPNTICALPNETPPLVIRVFGLKVGSEPFNEWQEAFGELNPRVNLFQESYLDSSKHWAMEPDLPFNKAKSRILMKPVSKKVMKKVENFFEKLEEDNAHFLAYFNFEAFGGAIPCTKGSFYPKQAFGWWFQAYYWDDLKKTDGILALSQKFYQSIPKEVSKYCYANIVDYSLGKHYLKNYYGNHVHRLIKIKRKYDPTNLFNWKQSIPLRYRPPHRHAEKVESESECSGQ